VVGALGGLFSLPLLLLLVLVVLVLLLRFLLGVAVSEDPLCLLLG
jgi:hypothetical protein